MDSSLPEVPKPFEPEPNRKNKILLGLVLFVIIVLVATIVLVLTGKVNLIKLRKSETATVEQESPEVLKIEKIISLIENPPKDFLDQVDEQLWQVQKDGILEGSGDPDKDLSGLNDVRDVLKEKQPQVAKNRMNRNLFRRLSSPLPAKNDQDEVSITIDESELNKLDPQRNFFFQQQKTAKVSKARYEATIEFLNLYYSL